LLQPRLNVKLSQRQVLTPGLVQMVSVLALNKLELKDMLNEEMVENPVLEEVEAGEESLEERSAREGDRERSAEEIAADQERLEKDPFDEVDFGSYFRDYLDPGFRTGTSYEDYEKPGFEHFLAQPSSLSDHLLWQLGALSLSDDVRMAAELIIGNLDESGYLAASDDELANELADAWSRSPGRKDDGEHDPSAQMRAIAAARRCIAGLDPAGVGARSLRECLLMQLQAKSEQAEEDGQTEHEAEVLQTARRIVEEHLLLLQKKDMRELVRLCHRPADEVNEAAKLIRQLDPRPGQRYNPSAARLIEPDVAFVKRDDEYVVVMNEDDLPSLRLNQSYRRMLHEKGTERDVREYVKERYRSAIQLLRNIEQRKNTILRTCEAIVRRQREFLERGIDGLKPMMIKDVAEEIGVHASTVSRAVANKYVYTTQGVYELRFFFSEGVNGPEGGDLAVLLKKRIRKLIEEEDKSRPKTDDVLTAELQKDGVKITRRTVAKYREEMHIPSTHQRRVR
jgi:RNA polymerase sigma-54 factor